MAQNHLFSNDPLLMLMARMDSMQREINTLRNSIAPRTKQYEIKILDLTESLTVGDGVFGWRIPHDVNRAILVEAHAYVITPSSFGSPSIQLRNSTTGFDMLLTPITIDINEASSYTASIQPVIDPSNSQVLRDALIEVDVDAAGVDTAGLGVILTFA